jgi:hypothetical protein
MSSSRRTVTMRPSSLTTRSEQARTTAGAGSDLGRLAGQQYADAHG